jgi:hypothetical protein
MAPREKAQELFDKMYSYTPIRANLTLIEEDKNTAKQCALIAVDEIIKDYDYEGFLSTKFWKEVKTEIENL